MSVMCVLLQILNNIFFLLYTMSEKILTFFLTKK